MVTTARFGTAILTLALAWVASPAHAKEQAAQFWISSGASFDLDQTTRASVSVTQRFRDETYDGDTQVVRGAVDWELKPWLSVGGGASYTFANAGNYLRTHQQVVLRAKQFSFRTRIEEGFFPGSDRIQIRLRERIDYDTSFGSRTNLNLWGELLYRLQSTDIEPDINNSDNWRFGATVEHDLSERVRGNIGYMMIIAPRSDEPDLIGHVPKIGLNYRF